MSEYDELVKRLRSAARAQSAGGGWTDPCAVENTIDWNAADAIEALVGEVERVKSQRDEYLQFWKNNAEACEAAEAERDRLKEAIERNAQNCIDTMNKMHAQHAAERDLLAGEVERLKRMLFPYAEGKEISGVTWNGFYLIGNKKSIDEFKRLENRAAQLETYRAEFVRRNEAAEAERDRLKAALQPFSDAYERLVRTQESMGFGDNATFGLGIKVSAIKAARKALGGDAS